MIQEVKLTEATEKLWNWAQSNGTKNTDILNDWDMVLVLAMESGWKK